MIRRFTSNYDLILKSVALGLAGCIVNAITYSFFGENAIALGYTAIFLSVLGFGLRGAFISGMILLLPELYITGNAFNFLRYIVILSSASLILKDFPLLPLSILVSVMWSIFSLSIFYVCNINYNFLVTNNAILNMAIFSDVLSALLASAIASNASFWCWLTNFSKPENFLHKIKFWLLSFNAIILLVFGWITIPDIQEFLANIHPPFTSLGITFLLVASSFVAKTIVYSVCSGLGLTTQGLSTESNVSSLTLTGISSVNLKLRASPQKRSSQGTWLSPDRLSLRSDRNSMPQSHNTNGVLVLSSHNTVDFVNKPFLTYTKAGITPDSAHGRSFDSIPMAPEFREAIDKLLKKLRNNEQSNANQNRQELKIRSESGSYQYFEISAKPSGNVSNTFSTIDHNGTIIIAQDITDRRSVNKQLMRTQKLEAMGALVDGLAHEFNNYLTSISARASLIYKKNITIAEAKKALSHIMEYTRSAANTIKCLLEFSSEYMDQTSIVNVSTMVQDKIEWIQKLVGENYLINLKTPSTSLYASINTSLLTQALTTLLLRAREAYESKPGEIKISINTEIIDETASTLIEGSSPGQYIRISVRDTGRPMTPQELKAFDPRTAVNSYEANSNVVGLSIVYSILKAHDGFLTAVSGEDGTEVCLYLPLIENANTSDVTTAELESYNSVVNEEEGEITVSSSPEIHNTASKPRILVVEDEPNVRELTTFMIEELGYEVQACESGEKALDLVSKGERFDLVVVDYIMPQIGGIELLEHLKTSTGKPKALIMTGYSTFKKDIKHDIPVLHKPFDINALDEAIRNILHR